MGNTTLPASPPTQTELRRELGLASATAAVAGECIAVGIFLTPAGMAKSLGSPLWLLAVWVFVGVMTLHGALCFGELAGRFPGTGGMYVYLREAFGRCVAFLYGWMCLLVLDPGLTAALAMGAASYAGYIFHSSPPVNKGTAFAAVWALCFLNIVSIRVSAGFLRWMTWLKLAVLGLLTVWATVFRLGSWSNFMPFVAQRPGSLPLIPALGAAMVGAFFSFGGWWDVSKIAGEVRNPSRILPRAFVFGVIAVTAVYILVTAVFLYLVPLQNVTSDETFVAQAGAVLFGRAGGIVLAAIVILCVLGSLAAFVISAPRVYYAMAKDRLFFPAFAKTHTYFRTPANAILLQGTVASLLLWLGTFQQVISYFMFVAIAFLGLTVAGIFVLRNKQPNFDNVTLAPAFPITPVSFLMLVVVLLVLIAVDRPYEAVLGIVVVLAGLPFYFTLPRRDKSTDEVTAL